MYVKSLIYALFLIFLPLSVIGQEENDTLPNYLFLENRLGDCLESENFMRFYIKPASEYKKIKSKYKRSFQYEFNSKLNFEENAQMLKDLHRFFVDPSCISNNGVERFLQIFMTPELQREILKNICKSRNRDTLIFNFSIENADGFKVLILNRNPTAAWPLRSGGL